MVEKPEGEDGEAIDDVKLTVIEPAPKPTPVGVGATEGSEEAEPADDSPEDTPDPE
jgi:hypothetical protein